MKVSAENTFKSIILNSVILGVMVGLTPSSLSASEREVRGTLAISHTKSLKSLFRPTLESIPEGSEEEKSGEFSDVGSVSPVPDSPLTSLGLERTETISFEPLERDYPRSFSATVASETPTSRPIRSLAKIVRSPSFATLAAAERAERDPQTLRILCLEGGGVRGIMELRFLQVLERELGRPVSDVFHMIAGTSAGGMSATALTTPGDTSIGGKRVPRYSADYLFNYMRNNSYRLFQRKWKSLWGLLGPKYKSTPVEEMAMEFFGETPITESTTDLMVTAYNLGAQVPKLFTSYARGETFSRSDVVMSTSAAPTYFKPRHVFPMGSTQSDHMGYILSDGGTYANNPVLCALSEAIRRYPDATNIELVCLGTGTSRRPVMYDDVKSAGLVTWGSSLVDLFMTGQASKDHHIVGSLFPGVIRGNYSCWSPVIEAANSSLDDTSARNINALIHAEDNMLRTRRVEFDALLERLRAPKSDLRPKGTGVDLAL